jgi:hypothetical protein
VPRSVTCPGCRRVLRVPDDSAGSEITCPRCLASVPTPDVPLAIAVEEEAPRERSCPRCGERVEDRWSFCPNCEAFLRGPQRGLRARRFDSDVRRDSTFTTVLMILLAVLGGIGLCMYFLAGVAAMEDSGPWLLFGVVLAVLLLSLISTGIMFWRTRDDPSRRGVGRVVVGTLALTGGLFALSCVLGLAFFLFLFIQCLTNPHGF